MDLVDIQSGQNLVSRAQVPNRTKLRFLGSLRALYAHAHPDFRPETHTVYIFLLVCQAPVFHTLADSL